LGLSGERSNDHIRIINIITKPKRSFLEHPPIGPPRKLRYRFASLPMATKTNRRIQVKAAPAIIQSIRYRITRKLKNMKIMLIHKIIH